MVKKFIKLKQKCLSLWRLFFLKMIISMLERNFLVYKWLTIIINFLILIKFTNKPNQTKPEYYCKKNIKCNLYVFDASLLVKFL